MLYDSDVIGSLAIGRVKEKVCGCRVRCCILKKHRSLPRSLSGVAIPAWCFFDLLA